MKRLKVTYFTLKQHGADGKLKNIGDRVIFLGVRNIMRCAIGSHDEEINFLDDDLSIPPDTDIAVICGMPQILNSRQSVILRRIVGVAQSSVPVKLNLGAGSFYFDAFGPDREAADIAFSERVLANDETKFYSHYAGFDAMTCRDHAGIQVLQRFEVAATALPCPGFFSAMFEPRPLLRSDRELVSVLNGTASFWNAVRADVHGFYRRLWEADSRRVFISHDEEDSLMLSDLDIPFVEFNDAEDFIRFLAGHERILSLRVHGALPSWTLGLDVTLLGLDRRALLGEDFGATMHVIPIRSEDDIRIAGSELRGSGHRQNDDARVPWIKRHLAEYVRLIRKPIRDKIGVELGGADESALDPVFQRNIDQYRGKVRKGQYFSTLFFSSDSEFSVPLGMFQTRHRIAERSPEKMAICTSTHKYMTLIFGPYIRLPAGLWKLEINLKGAKIPYEELSLILKISKGMPGVVLDQQVRRAPVHDSVCEFSLSLVFENPTDLGELEFILVSPLALVEGCEFELAPPRLSKVI